MENEEEYRSLMTDIISKQAVILGPEIAVMRARGVKGLTVTDDGKVEKIDEDCKETLQRLIDQYVQLSGQIVKATLGSIFRKYPTVEKEN